MYNRYSQRTPWQRFMWRLRDWLGAAFYVGGAAIVVAFIVTLIALPILWWGTIVYVAHHFLMKVW